MCGAVCGGANRKTPKEKPEEKPEDIMEKDLNNKLQQTEFQITKLEEQIEELDKKLAKIVNSNDGSSGDPTTLMEKKLGLQANLNREMKTRKDLNSRIIEIGAYRIEARNTNIEDNAAKIKEMRVEKKAENNDKKENRIQLHNEIQELEAADKKLDDEDVETKERNKAAEEALNKLRAGQKKPEQDKIFKSSLNSEAVKIQIQFEEADKNIIGQPPKTVPARQQIRA